MYDALEKFADVSLALHKAGITLPVAHYLLTRQTEIFAARTESRRHYYAESCQAGSRCRGVSVAASGGREGEKFIEVSFTMHWCTAWQRLLADSEKNLCSSIVSLDPDAWPNDLAPEHGERELAHFMWQVLSSVY